MKRCSVCGEPKAETEFNQNKRRKDGLQTKCKACGRKLSKAHYDSNKVYYRDKNRRRRQEIYEVVAKLKDGPCTDCGRRFPSYAMDFDHREGELKESCIAWMVRDATTRDRMLKEIAKCDLVCAVCHRIRTHNRNIGESFNGRMPGSDPVHGGSNPSSPASDPVRGHDP